jgi:hypothetical protein
VLIVKQSFSQMEAGWAGANVESLALNSAL